MTNLAYDAVRVPPDTLANRLRVAREWHGIDQLKIAEELGISRASVSNYENDHTRPGKLVVNAWAAYCDVDVEWLKNGWAPWDSNPQPTDYKSDFLSPNRSTFDDEHLATVHDINSARSVSIRLGDLVPA